MGPARTGLGLIFAVAGIACAHKIVRPTPDNPGVMHHVHSGETLWRIAKTYGVPLESLLYENDLRDPSHLSEGSLLFIPGAAKELAVPPAGEPPQARVEQRPRRGPSSIPRAGQRALDPAAHGSWLSWPASGVLISGFGTRERDHHDGIDLACPEGTPVRAAENGVVLFAGEQRGYGNLILVAHDDDLVTVYAHNSENLVGKGERVARGEAIARVGHSGNATGPHLHFEVRVGTHPRDPLGFLR
ncbi:MAG: peptidoglycan DD-metalloendopeptidase family protein [Myxococcales bacterium]|nr:LysM peptidoglycan-binding domain-containing M23 family metallopeptidase [Myxococcales bacterium]